MEHRFHPRPPVAGPTTVCAILSATVGTPSNASLPPCDFGISTAFTGGGKYVPEDIRFQILYRLPRRSCSNSPIDCVVHPRRTLLGLNPPVRLPHLLLRDHETACPADLGLLTRLLPEHPRLTREANLNDPAPSLRPHYRASRATTSRSARGFTHRYSAPRDFCRQALSLSPPAAYRRERQPAGACIGTRLPTFHAEAAEQARATSMPDTAWPVNGLLPGSSRDRIGHPGSDVISP